ncbi:MAG: ATP synthase F0 subunit B [Alphaproteobacteria bacterium]|nr:ATP synthase F0 subunit B [Alphaproteobacteria bacterium]
MHIIPDVLPSIAMTIPFLVAMVGLWVILWGPLMQFLDDRENATVGARKEATEFERQAHERADALAARLAEAKVAVQQIHTEARTRALAKEAEIVAAARAKADEYLTEAQARVADERLKAKAELESTARTLSTDIVDTLLA